MSPRVRRAIPWVFALAAFAFVAWIIPIRDRCWDPAAPASTKVAVTHVADGCLLHLRTGSVTIDAAQCSRLRCEPGLETTFAHARLGIVALLLILYGAGTVAWAARWRALLGFAGIVLPVSRVWRILIEAQAVGIILPGGIGGDALRIASVIGLPTRAGEVRAPPSIAVASVLLDRAIGLSTIAAIAAALGFFSRSADARVAAGPLELALTAIPVGVVVALVILRRTDFDASLLFPKALRARGGAALAPVLAYIRDPRAPGALLRAVGLSLINAVIQFIVIRGLVTAVGGAPTDEKWIYVGAAMAFIVSAIPALPGGWGTADAAYVFFFGLGGVPASEALAVCLLFRLFWYLSGVAGAVLQVALPQARAAAVVASPISKT